MTASEEPNRPRSGIGALVPAQEIAPTVLSTQPVSVEKGLAIQHGTPLVPARHPNLGLAPFDMRAGYPDAAARVRANKAAIARQALDVAVRANPGLPARYDDRELRRLVRDGELLTERLAMSLGADDLRWIAEYCEWIVPIYRRRRVPLGDLAAMVAGIADAVTAAPVALSGDALASATRALDAADVVLRRNGRVAGDRHKRRPILKWLYRGV